MQMGAEIAAAAAREHTQASLAGVKKKLQAAGVKFTNPDKKPFISAAAKVHDAFAAKRGPAYVELIKAINEAAKRLRVVNSILSCFVIMLRFLSVTFGSG